MTDTSPFLAITTYLGLHFTLKVSKYVAELTNPNLITRIIRRQESSVSPRPGFRSNSCPNEWLFIEDIPFDEYFDLSLFKTTSNSELLDLFPDPEFIR